VVVYDVIVTLTLGADMTRKQYDAKMDELVEKIRTNRGGPQQGAINLMAVIRLGQISDAIHDRFGTRLLALPVPSLLIKPEAGSRSQASSITLSWSCGSSLLSISVRYDLSTLLEYKDLGAPYVDLDQWRVVHDQPIPAEFIDRAVTKIERIDDD
jgi:hypothetical protein